MRCTRCDRLAIPQAMGQTPNGLVVFGWCLSCLRETGCTDIVVAWTASGAARPRWTRGRRKRASNRAAEVILARRSLLLGLVGVVLVSWGGVLAVAALVSLRRRPLGPVNPFGNGTPAFFLGGGSLAALIGLGILLALHGPAILRSRTFLQAIPWVASAGAIGLLVWGIVDGDPRHVPVFAVLAIATLGLSWIARRLDSASSKTPAADRSVDL